MIIIIICTDPSSLHLQTEKRNKGLFWVEAHQYADLSMIEYPCCDVENKYSAYRMLTISLHFSNNKSLSVIYLYQTHLCNKPG